MATVTGLTAAAITALVNGLVASAAFDGSNHLILTLHNGSTIDAGTPTFTMPDASTTTKGAVELATSAETSALTDTVRAVTPGGLSALMDTKSDSTHTHAFIAITGDVANSQLAQMATMTVKANNTGSTADPTDISVTDLWTMLTGGWQTWSLTLAGDTSNPTLGAGSSLVGQYRIYNNTFDGDASLTVGSGWSNGSGSYYITLPSSRAAANYKLGVGTGVIMSGNDVGLAAVGQVIMRSGGTKLYLATLGAGGWLGSGWSFTSGDQARWSIRGLRLA